MAAVTHRRVAEDAGVPLGSLTYWFAAKDDLLRETLRLFVEEEAERLRRGGGGLGGGLSPAEGAARFSAGVGGGGGVVVGGGVWLCPGGAGQPGAGGGA